MLILLKKAAEDKSSFLSDLFPGFQKLCYRYSDKFVPAFVIFLNGLWVPRGGSYPRYLGQSEERK